MNKKSVTTRIRFLKNVSDIKKERVTNGLRKQMERFREDCRYRDVVLGYIQGLKEEKVIGFAQYRDLSLLIHKEYRKMLHEVVTA